MRHTLAIAATAGLAACSSDDGERARELAQRSLIVDTHIDAPYRAFREAADLGVSVPEREFDYPRARLGGLDVAFMSIFTPARSADAGESREVADQLVDLVEALAARHPGKFAIAACTADAERLRGSGRIALALGMENASPLEGTTANLDHFVARGIRYVSLAHSKSNRYADSSYDLNERWQGLSDLGRQTVPELNRRGVMIDISHLSDKAAWQVLELSAAPVIASHSSLRHFIPGFHRNMSDDMVKAVAEGGGVVQINFGSGFVSDDARKWAMRRDGAMLAHFAGLEPDVEARREFREAYAAEHPYPFATVDTVLDHIDRTVALAGIDHVGLGSDFDGVGDTLPIGLKDVGDFPNLVAGLLERGYDEDAIAKILGLNLMRVWREVEQYAARQGFASRCYQSATILRRQPESG
ncbi:MAG: dipeptidase [Gammaproteobacteria bacterium]|nr:dipeptidase [Gammaproteobacteria bacterium]